MLWVQPRRRSAVTVSNFGLSISVAGLALTAPMIAVSPAAILLTCMFLAWPTLGWRHIGRNGTTVTVRRVFGSRNLEADRCVIGYRLAGGGRSAEFQVYITDGMNTVNLTEHVLNGTGSTERDVARLTALLLDPTVDALDARARKNSAARRKVERDRDQIEAGREYVRSYFGERGWTTSRRFWVPLVFLAGGALLYSVVMFAFLEVFRR